LFGTVVGILRAFKHIAETGDTGFSVVAGGISEALIATAAGIIVAVISVSFYNYLQVKATRLAVESRLHLDAFLESWMHTQVKS
jgi:biopolymer transport protein ExbB